MASLAGAVSLSGLDKPGTEGWLCLDGAFDSETQFSVEEVSTSGFAGGKGGDGQHERAGSHAKHGMCWGIAIESPSDFAEQDGWGSLRGRGR